MWRPACSVLASKQASCEGIPGVAVLGVVCETQTTSSRKPAKGEEIILILKPWNRRHKAALREEET